MNNKKITKNANTMMWVEYWIQQAHPSFKDYELIAEQYDCYRWICEIELPLINKTVKAISEKEVNAMLNASNKAAKLIEEYMESHPDKRINNPYKNAHWVVETNEDGKWLCTRINRAGIRKMNRQDVNRFKYISNTINKATKKILKKLNIEDGFYVKVIDRSLFSDDLTILDILEKTVEDVKKEHKMLSVHSYYNEETNSITIIGLIDNQPNWEDLN